MKRQTIIAAGSGAALGLLGAALGLSWWAVGLMCTVQALAIAQARIHALREGYELGNNNARVELTGDYFAGYLDGCGHLFDGEADND